jgi:hypothetical protein
MAMYTLLNGEVIELVQYLRLGGYSVITDLYHISYSISSIKRYGLLIFLIPILVANATTFLYTSADTIVVPPTSSMTNRSSSTITPITNSPSANPSPVPPTTSAVTISSSTINITTTTQQPQTQNLPAPSPNTLSGITTSGSFTASIVIPSADTLGGSKVPVYP